MNTDIFFAQGTTHKMCEDYALSNPHAREGGIKGLPYVIVCDGCSAARHVDIGARLLGLAAVQSLLERGDGIRNNLQSILASADIFRRALGLAVDSLSTTLVTATDLDNGFIEACCVGDGCLLGRRKGHDFWDLWRISFPGDAPYYLRYELNPRTRQEYMDQFGWHRIVEAYSFDAAGVASRSEIEDSSTNPDFTKYFDLDEYDIVMVTTDGIGAFQKGREPVLDIEVLQELVDFKNFAGEFVQRRCKRAFKTFDAREWQNTDDVGVGAIVNK